MCSWSGKKQHRQTVYLYQWSTLWFSEGDNTPIIIHYIKLFHFLKEFWICQTRYQVFLCVKLFFRFQRLWMKFTISIIDTSIHLWLYISPWKKVCNDIYLLKRVFKALFRLMKTTEPRVANWMSIIHMYKGCLNMVSKGQSCTNFVWVQFHVLVYVQQFIENYNLVHFRWCKL